MLILNTRSFQKNMLMLFNYDVPDLRRISIQRIWVAQLTHFAGECFFFQSPFEMNEMFCLLNKFVLFSYVDL